MLAAPFTKAAGLRALALASLASPCRESRVRIRSPLVGLVEQLDYVHPSPNALQRGVQQIASSRLGSWLFSKTLHHADLVLLRVSKGRTSLPGLTSGLPVITLTTTGAKSGMSRTMPLLGIPFGSDLAVIGSGFGMERTPAWVHNLRADPAATVQYRDRTVEARARKPTPEEKDQIWESARKLYPGYAVYPVRASHREISVFVLEPAVTGWSAYCRCHG